MNIHFFRRTRRAVEPTGFHGGTSDPEACHYVEEGDAGDEVIHAGVELKRHDGNAMVKFQLRVIPFTLAVAVSMVWNICLHPHFSKSWKGRLASIEDTPIQIVITINNSMLLVGGVRHSVLIFTYTKNAITTSKIRFSTFKKHHRLQRPCFSHSAYSNHLVPNKMITF